MYSLDQITQSIVNAILEAQNTIPMGANIKIPNCKKSVRHFQNFPFFSKNIIHF
jgi:hypothetical protein